MELSSLLTRYDGKSLFLPAHGRGDALPKGIRKLLRNRPGIWDLPELPGFGGPLISHGAVADSQKILASKFGASRGWYGVNGATGLLQAALLAVATPGNAVLMPRNVHRSLIQACILGDLTPILFDLPYIADRGHFIPPDLFWIRRVLKRLTEEDIKKISAVVLVNPSYQGYAKNIVPLVNEFHEKGLPVIVDEAHGAHFLLGLDDLPNSGLKAGADLVVHSLHKSSLGLVQTAILWHQGNLIDPICVERSIGLLQTTSPSALLLASCESSLLEFASNSGKRKLSWRINEAREIFQKLAQKGLPLIETQDPLKLLLHTARFGITGFQADEWMMSRGLIAELPEPGCLTFCLGLSPNRGVVKTLRNRWEGLLSSIPKSAPLASFFTPPFPLITRPMISPLRAWNSTFELMSLQDSEDEISAEMICPYPPGIPMVIPGELLDKKKVNWLLQQKLLWPNQIPAKIRVVS